MYSSLSAVQIDKEDAEAFENHVVNTGEDSDEMKNHLASMIEMFSQFVDMTWAKKMLNDYNNDSLIKSMQNPRAFLFDD